MSLSLILAVTLMPSVILLLLLGLAITWLRVRRANHDDVVDPVGLQKPMTPDPNYENRLSTEPFPHLPIVSLEDSNVLMDTAFTRARDSIELTRNVHHSSPVKTSNRTPADTLTTPPKRSSILSESPSSEALAAFDFDDTPSKAPIPTRIFDFADTPSKPPLPARSLRRSSGRSLTQVPTPIIKIEPASPSNPSLLFPQPDNQPLHLSPIAIGRAHARQTVEAISARANSTTAPPTSTSSSSLFTTAIPISHITSPTTDGLPPIPTRTSTLPTPPLSASMFPATPYPSPTNDLALRANRSMMEIEARLSRPEFASTKNNTAIEVAGLLGRKKSTGISMAGKRNSAIREYVRGFPEQNPWRRLMSAKGRREGEMQGVKGGGDGGIEEGEDDGEDEFMRKFGGEEGGMV